MMDQDMLLKMFDRQITAALAAATSDEEKRQKAKAAFYDSLEAHIESALNLALDAAAPDGETWTKGKAAFYEACKDWPSEAGDSQSRLSRVMNKVPGKNAQTTSSDRPNRRPH